MDRRSLQELCNCKWMRQNKMKVYSLPVTLLFGTFRSDWWTGDHCRSCATASEWDRIKWKSTPYQWHFCLVHSGQIDGQEITAGAVHLPRPIVRPPIRRSPPRRPPPRWRNSPPRFGGRRWAEATVTFCSRGGRWLLFFCMSWFVPKSVVREQHSSAASINFIQYVKSVSLSIAQGFFGH